MTPGAEPASVPSRRDKLTAEGEGGHDETAPARFLIFFFAEPPIPLPLPAPYATTAVDLASGLAASGRRRRGGPAPPLAQLLERLFWAGVEKGVERQLGVDEVGQRVERGAG